MIGDQTDLMQQNCTAAASLENKTNYVRTKEFKNFIEQRTLKLESISHNMASKSISRKMVIG